jgi:hypothetical protein
MGVQPQRYTVSRFDPSRQAGLIPKVLAKSGGVCRVPGEIPDFAFVAASCAAYPVKVRPVFRGAVRSVSLGSGAGEAYRHKGDNFDLVRAAALRTAIIEAVSHGSMLPACTIKRERAGGKISPETSGHSTGLKIESRVVFQGQAPRPLRRVRLRPDFNTPPRGADKR